MNNSGLFATNTPIHAPKQPTQESINAVIYVRTSPGGRDKEGYSIPEQIKTCWDRCQSLDWNVSHIYRDIDESGKNTERPEFQQMLSDIKLFDIDVVVFWKLDRFSRSLKHAVELEERLREHGVAMHSVTELLDTTTVAGRFNFRSIASASEFERELTRERSELWVRNAARNRKWPSGSPPLGYSLDGDNKLVPIDNEVELVNKIFKKYRDIRSMPKLAKELNQQGEVTKNENQWTTRGVGEILRNELYIGRYQVGPADDHVDEYQIVADDLFEEVTQIRYRFQSGEASRESMEKSRKREHVKRIKQQYFDYLSQTSTDSQNYNI